MAYKFRASLSLDVSLLALTVAAAFDVKPAAACTNITGDTAITTATSNCLSWQAGNLTIANGGTITTGSRAITIAGYDLSSKFLSIASGGTIHATSWATVELGNNSKLGTIVNSGHLLTPGSTSNIVVDSNATLGTITNSGAMSGYVADYAGSIGVINNVIGGTIGSGNTAVDNQSNSTIGVITNVGTINGSIANYSGSITSIGNGDGTNTALIAGITNSGTIGVNTNDPIKNLNHGSIGFITNSGFISSNGDIAIDNDGGTIGTISNSGSIAAIDTGIYNNGSSATIGTITNSGTISGTGGCCHVSVNNNNGTIGTITNTSSGNMQGYISNYSAGSIGTISNAGTIAGYSGTGIYNNATIGTIVNTGTISLPIKNYNTISFINNESGGTIGNGSATYAILNNNGGTTISTIANAGTLIASSSAIYNNNGATIGTITNTGSISGSNGITNNASSQIMVISNAASSTISGENAAIYNNGGTIGTVTNAGVLTGYPAINNSGTLSTLSNTGAITSSSQAIINSGTIGALVNSGTISGAQDAISSTGTFTGAISNSGTISGTISASQNLTITGGSSGNLGVLTGGAIVANNLTFDNAAFQLLGDNINVGSGSGTITNNGTLQVNATRTITGNYSQSSSALLKIGVTNASNYGKIVVSGNASMANDQITIVPLSGVLSSTETFTIAQVSGSYNFSGITATATGFTPQVSSIASGGYEDLIIDLSGPKYGTIGAAAGGGSAPSVGTALDQIKQLHSNGDPTPGFDPSVLTDLNNLGQQSQTAEQSGIKQLGPTQLTPQLVSTNFQVNQTTGVISQHQDQLTQNTHSEIGRAAGSEYQSGAFWGQISGGTAFKASDSASDGYHQNYYGITFGADNHIDDKTTLGGALSWNRSNARGLDSLAGNSVGVNNVQLTAYGTHRYDELFVNAMLGVGYNMFNQSRDIAFLGQTAKAKYSGMQYMTKLDGGYDIDADVMTVTPVAGFQAVRTVDNGYTESGTSANVAVGHMGYNTYTTSLGAKFSTDMDTDWGKLVPEMKTTWSHDLQRGVVSTSATMGGVAFSTATPRVAQNGLGLSLAATLKQDDDVAVRVEYDGDIRDGYQSHSGLVKLNIGF
ncbi:MAG: autotransporter domain-containing protein [Alphaproteobacteria bacterium]|nr:autotransporter domain-containing protein [Alphaproteobacteria bacterium]MBV8549335.1 autotransporter domain-containing protein [Alphaproteobacteria bacterium]